MVDLLVSMGLRILRLPSLGIAEHGLDIAAVGRINGGPRTLYLIQVKQGDITRALWNQGPNSVRASLDDLEDYAEEALELAGRPVPEQTVLVLAHNGTVSTNVQSAFTAHRKRMRQRNSLEVEHWDLHRLLELFEAHLFDEHFFSQAQALSIRKALAFVEVPEYDLHHFRKFLDATIPPSTVSIRLVDRALLQVQIALAMVYHYGTVEGANYDVSRRAYEIALLRVYLWLHHANLLSKQKVVQQLSRIVNTYLVISLQFLAKLDPLLGVYHGLARTGLHERVEYPLRVLKIGALAGQWMIFLGRRVSNGQPSDELKAMGDFVARFLTRLRASCPVVERPLLDEQMIEVCLFGLGLRVAGGESEMAGYLDSVISRMCLEARNGHPIPDGSGDMEAVARLVMNNTVVDWYSGSSSTLLAMLAEMTALLDLQSLYSLIRETWGEKVDFQVVYLNGRFIEWACGDGRPVEDEDARVEPSIQLLEDVAAFLAEIDRKRPLDADLGSLLKLPFFELVMHIASRINRVPLSPLVWRGLRAPTPTGRPDSVSLR